MPAAGELAGPVDYAGVWTWVAVGLVVAVLVWNLGVLWWGRPRRVVEPQPVAPRDPADVRREHLARLDRVEAEVRAGRLDLRAAYQEMSATARSYVHETTEVPARHLTLADLRGHELPQVVAAVEVMYPPEFAPGGEDVAAARFDEALRRAREVVTSPWT